MRFARARRQRKRAESLVAPEWRDVARSDRRLSDRTGSRSTAAAEMPMLSSVSSPETWPQAAQSRNEEARGSTDFEPGVDAAGGLTRLISNQRNGDFLEIVNLRRTRPLASERRRITKVRWLR